MKVRFDSLNRFESPNLSICNPGSTYSNGVTTKTLGIFRDTSDEEIVFNFNTTSQLSFRAYSIEHDDPEENEYAAKLFSSLQNRRLIFVDDIGYFIITNVDEHHERGLMYKDITASSCELEIQNKGLTYIENGTYPFDELFEKVVATLPKWTIGSIASGVKARHRTFEEIDYTKNTLAFLLEDMQNAYECIFVFDIVKRQINVYDQHDYVVRTSIHITNDSLIKHLQITEDSENIYTAINVLGSDELGISAINPLGTNTIYNFSYYLDWMSDSLRKRVIAWNKLVDDSFDSYYNYNLQYYNKLSARSELTAELERLNIVLDMYRKCRENIVAASNTSWVSNYNEIIAENGGVEIAIRDEIADTILSIDELITSVTTRQIPAVERNIADTDAQINHYLDDITKIHNAVAINKYFSVAEYDELYDYIFEGSYTDEYITVTDIMTYQERFEQMATLYDRAKEQMRKISAPTQEFTVDSESFIFSKDFMSWSEQLETGCLINVELKPDDVAALFLSSMTVNYGDQKLSFTFGNRFNRFDPQALFNNVLGGISKSTNSIDYIKDIIYPIKDGQLDSFAEALKNMRNLTMDAALSSDSQDFIIDATGLTGRKKYSDGTFDQKQLKIVNNSMVFTSDGWDSCHTAIGEIILDDGNVVYGVNAKTVIGEIILGSELHIIDGKTNQDIFTVMDDKVESRITDPDTGVTAMINQGINKIELSVKDKGDSSTITLTKDNVQIASGEIDLSGMVRFSDLSQENSETVINGSNITTGTINAIDIESVNISGSDITGGTITGATIISEDSSDHKVVISDAEIQFRFGDNSIGYLRNYDAMFSLGSASGSGSSLSISSDADLAVSNKDFTISSMMDLHTGLYTNSINSTGVLKMYSDSNMSISANGGLYIGSDKGVDTTVYIGRANNEVRLYGDIYVNDTKIYSSS